MEKLFSFLIAMVAGAIAFLVVLELFKFGRENDQLLDRCYAIGFTSYTYAKVNGETRYYCTAHDRVVPMPEGK
jgi:hypothetical protein